MLAYLKNSALAAVLSSASGLLLLILLLDFGKPL